MNGIKPGGEQFDPGARVRELADLYGADDACAAALLCDDHPPGAMAYRIVRSDYSTTDITYGELRRESEKFAAALRSIGIGPGDRVATLMGKSREYLITLLGIWRLGAVHVPLFTAFAPAAIAVRLRGSNAKAVVCDFAQRSKLAPGEDIPADPPWRLITTGCKVPGELSFEGLMSRVGPGLSAAVVGGEAPLIHIYTSGTTGNPKGVVVPVRALASFRAYSEFGLDLRPDDLFWCAADPGWAYGLYFGILATFSTGTPSILSETGFTPEGTMAILEQEGVTNFAAAPTVYRALRASGLAPAQPLQLRCCSSAGEPLTPDVNDWAKDILGTLIHDHYGQTETGMLINNHHHPALRRVIRPGSMGIVMPGWEASVLDAEREEEAGANQIGRLAMKLEKSPLAWFRGYGDDPAKAGGKFSKDGRWYITGDTAMVDEDGHYYFSARDDDVIIMAGYRIGPFEVESVIATHPAVAESAIIAVPDAVRGEVVEAYVVLREGHIASAELELEIQQWVKKRYAAHAYPRKIHFTGALPRTPSGKVQRFVLKAERRRQLAAQPSE